MRQQNGMKAAYLQEIRYPQEQPPGRTAVCRFPSLLDHLVIELWPVPDQPGILQIPCIQIIAARQQQAAGSHGLHGIRQEVWTEDGVVVDDQDDIVSRKTGFLQPAKGLLQRAAPPPVPPPPDNSGERDAFPDHCRGAVPGSVVDQHQVPIAVDLGREKRHKPLCRDFPVMYRQQHMDFGLGAHGFWSTKTKLSPLPVMSNSRLIQACRRRRRAIPIRARQNRGRCRPSPEDQNADRSPCAGNSST